MGWKGGAYIRIIWGAFKKTHMLEVFYPRGRGKHEDLVEKIRWYWNKQPPLFPSTFQMFHLHSNWKPLLCLSNLFSMHSYICIHINTHLQMTNQKQINGASLVAQWWRIRLPMQGTRVQDLVQEDPTCCRATKLVRHNYWACALEPASHNYWACVPQLLKPARLEPVLRNKRSHRNEKPPQWEAPQWRVAPARRT